jgi:hypothetical protein
MLDKPTIGEKEQTFLTCEMCGMKFGDQERNEEDDDIGFDYKNIDETGMCYVCEDNQ